MGQMAKHVNHGKPDGMTGKGVVMRYGRRSGYYSAILFVCVLSVACIGAAPPDTVPRSPVATVAIKGQAIVAAARAVLPIIDQQMDAGTLPKPAGIRILQSLKLLGQQAGFMAQALAIVDATQVGTPENAQAVMNAKVALAHVQQSLVDAIGADPGVVTEVMRLLANVTLTVSEAAAAIGGR